jgi:hypothetical protein
MVVCRPVSGKAISNAVRNWLDTSPRTLTFPTAFICRRYVQRRISGLAKVIDGGAQTAQRIDQIADRPLVHARHARQAVFAAAQRERRGQRPESGAGVAEKQFGGLDRKCAARAAHECRTAVLPHGNAECAQGFEHVRRRNRAGRADASAGPARRATVRD